MADQISDAILDAALAQDPGSRVAVRDAADHRPGRDRGRDHHRRRRSTTPSLARAHVRDIGYDGGELGFDGHAVGVLVALDKQSPDIAQGVDPRARRGPARRRGPVRPGRRRRPGNDVRLRDQRDPRAHAAADHAGAPAGAAAGRGPRKPGSLPYLRPDGKTQVTVRYDAGGRPVQVEKVLISTQHAEGAEDKLPDALWEHVVTPVLPADLYDPADLRDSFYVNPTGRFVIGGPVGDAGVTGRKIIVDTYGGFARHGGGAFSGKDPSKVDRCAAYAARYVAKNVVAAGLADRAEVQVAYAIGMARPFSLLVDTFGTEKVSRARSVSWCRRTSTCARPRSATTSTCAARATASPPPTATSGAASPSSPGSAPTRRRRCAVRPGSGRARAPAGIPTWASGRRRGTRGRRCCPGRRPCRPRASRGRARTG